MSELSDFDYPLPQEQIAQKPAEPRDHSRLLIYDRKLKTITDDYFYNISAYLPKDSVLAVNNSKVEKARMLFGKKEVFITKTIDPVTVEAMIRPGKAFKPGKTVVLVPSLEHDSSPVEALTAEVLHIANDGLRTLRFNLPIDHPALESYRHTPFPPYIKPNEQLSDRYQTIFAKDQGSKAAPTAGLHFTNRVFSSLDQKGISRAEVTLHVGLGTFAPVKTDRIQDHKMHSEWYSVSDHTARFLNQASFITAVGTTTARVLESEATRLQNNNTGHQAPFRSFSEAVTTTDIFITPGYSFKAVDALITNFHLPKSTLLMMVAAFTGLDEMHRIYQHAIENKYRFYSFGDAMLLI
ncbi:tRNA preQ1(34) S-adenosylmethionine ribosyltransferase-isomerase QueA [Balneolaceae bacterium ANBcel3]|nr:tRNA preQ1(34) S-adenosylmethionine ribosyltransferase-isomerase QueA [Balneolaceae bacterium ANBcel3]